MSRQDWRIVDGSFSVPFATFLRLWDMRNSFISFIDMDMTSSVDFGILEFVRLFFFCLLLCLSSTDSSNTYDDKSRFFTGKATMVGFFSNASKTFRLNRAKCRMRYGGRWVSRYRRFKTPLFVAFFWRCSASEKVRPSNLRSTETNGSCGMTNPPSSSLKSGFSGMSRVSCRNWELIVVSSNMSLSSSSLVRLGSSPASS
mmetsp:Transcript_59485/g.69531  ORF Transcript_59485/g.69531 Transcript_59485/m.69531 type:complete len:200 (+) Transcript_59485:582-1181(+)